MPSAFAHRVAPPANLAIGKEARTVELSALPARSPEPSGTAHRRIVPLRPPHKFQGAFVDVLDIPEEVVVRNVRVAQFPTLVDIKVTITERLKMRRLVDRACSSNVHLRCGAVSKEAPAADK